MTRTSWIGGLTVGATALVTAAAAAHAHHSIAAQFELDKSVTVVGTVAKMEFRNPHSWLYVDAKDESGRVEQWAVEFGSVNSLFRRGWKREDLPVGATVAVTGYPALDGSKTVGATDVKLPDGRTLFAGTAPNEGGR